MREKETHRDGDRNMRRGRRRARKIGRQADKRE